MQVKFRVDAGNQIGLGHLIRCLSIVQILRRKSIDCLFFIRQTDESIYDHVRKESASVLVLNDDNHFFHYLDKEDFVIMDGYHFDASYEFRVKERIRRLITIDDLLGRHFYADVIINHTPGINAALYNKEDYARVYTGQNYCLLRDAFFTSVPRQAEAAPVVLKEGILCLGGADPGNQTLSILKSLIKTSPAVSLNVVVGSSYRHLESLIELTNRFTQINYYVNLDVHSLIALIQRTDFAVVSASTISLECLYLRIPTYLVKTAENQDTNYQYLLKNGLAASYIDFGKYSFQIGNAMLKKQSEFFVGDIRMNIENAILS